MASKVNIDDYIELYKKGLTLDKIKPLKKESNRQTYNIFKESNLDIRVIDRNLVYQNPKAFEKIKYFVNQNPYFYMIPVTTIKETITGFILRGVTNHSYSTISRSFDDPNKQVPFMFGFDSSFIKLGKSKRCLPIVICEGCKDCLTIKKFYPYVLANNTSSMGINAAILTNLSDRFLLAYDKDKAGQDGIQKDKEELQNSGAVAILSLDINEKFKDCADYIGHPKEFSELKNQIKDKLQRLYKAG